MLRIIIIILLLIAGINQGFASPADTVYVFTTQTVYDTVYETIIVYDTTDRIYVEKLDNPFIPVLVDTGMQPDELADALSTRKNTKVLASQNTQQNYPGKSRRIKNGRNFFEPIVAAFRYLFEPRPLPVADYKHNFQEDKKVIQSTSGTKEDIDTKIKQRDTTRKYPKAVFESLPMFEFGLHAGAGLWQVKSMGHFEKSKMTSHPVVGIDIGHKSRSGFFIESGLSYRYLKANTIYYTQKDYLAIMDWGQYVIGEDISTKDMHMLSAQLRMGFKKRLQPYIGVEYGHRLISGEYRDDFNKTIWLMNFGLIYNIRKEVGLGISYNQNLTSDMSFTGQITYTGIGEPYTSSYRNRWRSNFFNFTLYYKFLRKNSTKQFK